MDSLLSTYGSCTEEVLNYYSTISGIVANAFGTCNLTSWVITSCRQCGSSHHHLLEKVQVPLVALQLLAGRNSCQVYCQRSPTFMIVSQTFEVMASFLLFGGSLLQVDTSCSVADTWMRSGSKGRNASSGCEGIDRMLSFVDRVCMSKGRERRKCLKWDHACKGTIPGCDISYRTMLPRCKTTEIK